MGDGRSPAVGVTFRPQWPPERLPAFATDVEDLGYDELWVVEDCFFGGGLTLATVALAATSRLRVGIGLLPTAVRNPAIVAMELAGIARIHPGRLTVAFGHGVESWMRQINARPRDRLALLGETLSAVRGLLRGEAMTMSGDFVSLNEVRLDHPPPEPPRILVGTTGRRGLEIAGRHADGLLLPEGASPAAVRWAREIAAAHDPNSATVVYVWAGADQLAARSVLRPELARWLASGLYPQLARHLSQVGGDALDGLLDEVALVGSPAACAAAIRRWAAAGADSVVLRTPLEQGAVHIERFARDVLPILDRTAG